MFTKLIEYLYWRQLEKRVNGNLVKHAQFELVLRGGSTDEMQQAMNKHLMRMVRVFSDEGHSGFSASYAISALKNLLAFKPLGPLTGEPEEWTEVYNGCEQNKRCSHVFRENGQAYDINGRVFEDPDGCRYTNSESRVNITFPYTPTIEVVKRT